MLPPSQEIPAWIFGDSAWAKLGSTARLTLYVLRWAADHKPIDDHGSLGGIRGGAWLETKVGVTHDAISNALGQLQDAGFLVRLKRGGGRPNASGQKIASLYAIPGHRGAMDKPRPTQPPPIVVDGTDIPY